MPALVAALKKWMPPPRGQVPESAGANGRESPKAAVSTAKVKASPQPNGSAIDPRAIRDTFGDDDDTFREILQSFVEPSQEIIVDLGAACEHRNAGDVKDAAHKLKSSARTVGAHALADTCVALEAAGNAADWTTIDKLTPLAREQFQDVAIYISSL